MTTSNRLAFFDNLRVVLMVVVIAHHVGQAYGPTGGWWPVQEPTRAAILGPFFMVNRSFGMSLFFLIAGYFTVMACDRHGPRAFLKSRLLRLGLPLLAFSLFVLLLQVFVFGPLDTGELGPIWPINVMHMWFVQHLLIFSVVYALWRMARPAPAAQRQTKVPGFGTILAFVFGLALATAIVRTWFDIDEWVYLLGYIRVAFADVPRDLGMFIVGALAYRHNWALRFPSRAGRVWLGVGLTLAALWYAYDLWLNGVFTMSDTAWGLVIPVWESLLCVGMCIGLTILFRDLWNTQGRLLIEMGKSTYAAYVFHVFIVLLVQYLALGLTAPPLVKFTLVTLVSVPVTFLIAGLVRRPLRM